MNENVTAFVVGRKRVHVTAYCPDDAYGFAAELFLVERMRALLPGEFSEHDLREWMHARNPEAAAAVFAALDAGQSLPKTGALLIAPGNAPAELRLAAHIKGTPHADAR